MNVVTIILILLSVSMVTSPNECHSREPDTYNEVAIDCENQDEIYDGQEHQSTTCTTKKVKSGGCGGGGAIVYGVAFIVLAVMIITVLTMFLLALGQNHWKFHALMAGAAVKCMSYQKEYLAPYGNGIPGHHWPPHLPPYQSQYDYPFHDQTPYEHPSYDHLPYDDQPPYEYLPNDQPPYDQLPYEGESRPSYITHLWGEDAAKAQTSSSNTISQL